MPENSVQNSVYSSIFFIFPFPHLFPVLCSLFSILYSLLLVAINFFQAGCQFCPRARRARGRTNCAPPDLNISAHGNALLHIYLYYLAENYYLVI